MLLLAGVSEASVTQRPSGAFESRHELMLPGAPASVWDAITGDLTPWWDHSFRTPPYRLVLEPRMGGRFFEAFDDSGHGSVHATVSYADKPVKLVFVGPLGLSGHALDLVVSYELEAVGDSTRLRVTCRGAGELEPNWAQAVDTTWAHFIFERFRPYYLKLRSAPAR